MPSIIPTQDVERQIDGVQTPPQKFEDLLSSYSWLSNSPRSHCAELLHALESKDRPSFQERAGHGCFLCLESHHQGQYAILVPCLRPTEPRRMVEHCGNCIKYEKKVSWHSACESDEDIYRRLIDTCYQHLGWWKRWLPYYGITGVLEVNFQFSGSVDLDGHYSICMNSINLDNVLKECKETIARHLADQTDPCFKSKDGRSDHNTYSRICLIRWQEYDQPCTSIKAEKARQRRKRLLFLPDLKECARNPEKANGLYTLQGLAQESCIYDTKGPSRVKLPLPYQKFEGTDWMRGMQFVLGWQTDRMRVELPFKFSFAWCGIASIWLGLVFCRGVGGDWGTAFAFAQVIAASVAIIVTCIQS